MKSRTTIILSTFLLALPSIALGQAVQQKAVVDGAAAFVLPPAMPGTTQPPASERGRTVDIVGGTSNVSLGRFALAKGNSYEVTTSTTLNEAEFWIGFSNTQTLTYYVYDSPVEMGLYTQIYVNSAQVAGTGAGWYSTGPISVPLNAGMYYIIAVSWDGAMDYWYGVGDTQATSFGAYVHGHATGTDPLGPTISSTTNDQAIYHQRLTTGAPVEPGTTYCAGDGNGTGCPCVNNNNGSMGGCDWGNPAFPEGGVLGAVGSDSFLANDTFLVATGIEDNFGIFFGAANQVNGGNGNPLNDGLRCAGGSLVRLIPPTVATGNQATTPLPIQTLDTGAANGVTRRYQYWFRTPTGPCGQMANLTNGYEIVWMP